MVAQTFQFAILVTSEFVEDQRIMKNKELGILAQECKTSSDFLAFVEKLAADFRENGGDWRTKRIDHFFLFSAVAWAQHSGIDHCDFSDINPWRSMAIFLFCGKAYDVNTFKDHGLL